MTHPEDSPTADSATCCGLSRRSILCGTAIGALGSAEAMLSGCSDSGEGAATPGPTTVGPASGVPVGSGRIYKDKKIVVTQPTADQYKAFSAVCTHAGCLVDGIADGTIRCPCHGSRFEITDGSVAQGPATTALPSHPVTVQDGKLVVTL